MFFNWLLIAITFALILAPFVWMVIFALTQVKRGWRVFYAAWALAILLALVLPFAIPYAIWPDYDSPCASYAKGGLGEEHRGGPFALTSVRVLDCPDDDVPRFAAEVTFHGPYGVPTGTYLVTSSDAGGLVDAHTSGELLGLIALVAGVFAVSTPFLIVRARMRVRQLRLAPA